jgi:hypothetical protein
MPADCGGIWYYEQESHRALAPDLVGLGLGISHPAQARLRHSSGCTATAQELPNLLTRYSPIVPA